MANYVYNFVNIAFPSESEKEAAKAVLLKEGEFDFNHIIPMPESLNIEDGSVTQHAAVYVARETGMLERGRFETLPEKAKTCLQKFLRFSDKTGLTLWKYANAVEYRGRLLRMSSRPRTKPVRQSSATIARKRKPSSMRWVKPRSATRFTTAHPPGTTGAKRTGAPNGTPARFPPASPSPSWTSLLRRLITNRPPFLRRCLKCCQTPLSL